jgi:hypothetical protein
MTYAAALVPPSREPRDALVRRMADDLVRFDAIKTEPDAVRALYGAGYSAFEVCLLVGEARALAFQSDVEKEMSES